MRSVAEREEEGERERRREREGQCHVLRVELTKKLKSVKNFN